VTKDLQIRANGATFRCRVEGPLSAQVLLFSNALATDMSMWDEQAVYFSKNYQVVRFDARGHGGSQSTPPPYSLSTLVEDVRSLLDGLGVGSVHFVGLSLGGMVGQLFAARYPQRLLSVALCDTAARMKRDIWEGRIDAVRSEGIAPQVEPSLERWFTKPFRDKNPQVIGRFRKMIQGTSLDGYVGSATAIMELDSINQLSRIATPTLVVVGRHDPATPVNDAELISQKIAGSELAVIEDAAHLPNIEQSTNFNEILDDFLKRQSARSQAMGLAGE
jgi:3-oxoadipate enol-lactonase